MPDSIDLKKFLKRLGANKLSNLVGNERLEAIHETLSASVTESRMVDILYRRYGASIFEQKEIRRLILSRLPDPYAGYVLDGTDDEKSTLNATQREKLISMRWGLNNSKCERLIEVFGLGETYLPQKKETPLSEICITPELTLFAHQRRLKDHVVRTLAKGSKRILVHMPTGAGKTRTCTEALADYWRGHADRDGFFVWLAHSEELCEQAVETLTKIWSARGDASMTLYRLWGSQPIPSFNTENAFVVASLQKLHSMRTTQSNESFDALIKLQQRCRVIVVDEAHKAIAPTYKESIDFLFNDQSTKLIGLTATPGRGIDSPENKDLVKFFDGNKIGLSDLDGNQLKDPIGYLQESEFLAKVLRRKVPSNITLDLTDQELIFVQNFLELPSSVLSKLGENTQRNLCIVSEIAALVHQGRNIIVFACSVEHAHLLSELLNLKEIYSRCIDGSTNSADRINWIQDFKDSKVSVLVNYGVLTTGFDAPNTNAVVITRPTGSIVLYSQMLGRGIRGPKVGGNADCILVDIEDNLIGFPDERKAFTFFDESWNG